MYFEEQVKQRNQENKETRCNGCPAAEINDNRMHMDRTRSTTSRHAAMVKRTFNRARDPQRMWISRDYHKMRYGQKHFCVKSNFCVERMLFKTTEKRRKSNFLRRSNKSHFLKKNKDFKKFEK